MRMLCLLRKKWAVPEHYMHLITFSTNETLSVALFDATPALTLFNAKYEENRAENNLKFIHFWMEIYRLHTKIEPPK